MTNIHLPSAPVRPEAPRGVRSLASATARVLALTGVSVGVALALAACGGDDNEQQPATQVPASAASSDAALESFAISQPQSETGEPLALDNITTLPSSETEEPIAVP